MNQKKSKSKVSSMMKMMNYLLYTVFAFQMLIIIIFASLSTSLNTDDKEGMYYIGTTEEASIGLWIINFFMYWVTFSHMIPISLYVIIEMLKLT